MRHVSEGIPIPIRGPQTAGLSEGKRRQVWEAWAREQYRQGSDLVPPEGAMLCPECMGASWVGDEANPQPCGSCTIGIVFLPVKDQTRSGVPEYVRHWTFATYPGPAAALETAREFATNPYGWAKTSGRRGLMLAGDPGRGKTGLAAGIAHEAERLHMAVRWLAWGPWLAELKRTFNPDDPRDPHLLIDHAARADLLILDDLGTRHGEANPWRSEMAQALLDASAGPIVVTTMLTPDEMAAQLGEHVASRLWGACLVEFLDGADLRRAA